MKYKNIAITYGTFDKFNFRYLKLFQWPEAIRDYCSKKFNFLKKYCKIAYLLRIKNIVTI